VLSPRAINSKALRQEVIPCHGSSRCPIALPEVHRRVMTGMETAARSRLPVTKFSQRKHLAFCAIPLSLLFENFHILSYRECICTDWSNVSKRSTHLPFIALRLMRCAIQGYHMGTVLVSQSGATSPALFCASFSAGHGPFSSVSLSDASC